MFGEFILKSLFQFGERVVGIAQRGGALDSALVINRLIDLFHASSDVTIWCEYNKVTLMAKIFFFLRQ